MRLPVLLLLFAFSGGAARAQGNSDFPQTGSAAGSGGSPDFQQVRPQSPQGAVNAPQDSNNPGAAPGASDGGGERARDAEKGREQGAAGAGRKQRHEHPPGSDHEGAGIAPERGEAEPMDLNGARVNFATVVDSYFAKRSAGKGFWAYAEKTGKKKAGSRHLADPRVSEPSIRHKGGNRYSGLVTFSDARRGRPLRLEFVVDFSGSNWRVVSARPAAVSSRR